MRKGTGYYLQVRGSWSNKDFGTTALACSVLLYELIVMKIQSSSADFNSLEVER
jgi:hypothetical protein